MSTKQMHCLIATTLFCVMFCAACSSDSSDHRQEGGTHVASSIDSEPLPTGMMEVKDDSVWLLDLASQGYRTNKLKRGDRCTYDRRGHVEIINGTLDYWYLVDFEGSHGWIFGGHTSGFKMINIEQAATPRAAWDKQKESDQLWCKISPNPSPEDYGQEVTDTGCVWSEEVNGNYIAKYNGGGSGTYWQIKHVFSTDTMENLWFCPIAIEDSSNYLSDGNDGTSIVHSHATALGIYDGTWKLSDARIDGRLADHYAIDTDTTLFVFDTSWIGATQGEQSVTIWRHIRSTNTFERIQMIDFGKWSSATPEKPIPLKKNRIPTNPRRPQTHPPKEKCPHDHHELGCIHQPIRPHKIATNHAACGGMGIFALPARLWI